MNKFTQHNVPWNEISNDDVFNQYCNSCVDWFQDEVILISFIDKLVQVDYDYYLPIIKKLHNILIISLRILLSESNLDTIYGFQYGIDYILYLLNNQDLSKLKPTQTQFGFMYISYYQDFYNIALTDLRNNDQLIPLYILINHNDNAFINDQVFRLLFDNISIKIQEHINNAEKEHFVSSMHQYDDDDDDQSSKRRRIA